MVSCRSTYIHKQKHFFLNKKLLLMKQTICIFSNPNRAFVNQLMELGTTPKNHLQNLHKNFMTETLHGKNIMGGLNYTEFYELSMIHQMIALAIFWQTKINHSAKLTF
jgi:hypothetical protein